MSRPAGFAVLYLQDRVEGSQIWFAAMARRRRRQRVRLAGAVPALLVLAIVAEVVIARLGPFVDLPTVAIIPVLVALAPLALLPGSSLQQIRMYADTAAALEEAAATGRRLIRASAVPASEVERWVERVEAILAAADADPAGALGHRSPPLRPR